MKNFGVKLVITGGILLFIALVLSISALIGSMSNKDKIKIFLGNQGFSQIEMTGFEFFSCSRGDLFKDGFKAVNQQGHEVKGVVCQGIFKGKTIRFH